MASLLFSYNTEAQGNWDYSLPFSCWNRGKRRPPTLAQSCADQSTVELGGRVKWTGQGHCFPTVFGVATHTRGQAGNTYPDSP